MSRRLTWMAWVGALGGIYGCALISGLSDLGVVDGAPVVTTSIDASANTDHEAGPGDRLPPDPCDPNEEAKASAVFVSGALGVERDGGTAEAPVRTISNAIALATAGAT